MVHIDPWNRRLFSWYFNILNHVLLFHFHRALFTYEGNSNDIRLVEKGGE